MANRTVKDAHSIKGTNPQYLVEKIIRTRIYECRYWKEECFALTAALLVDKAMELRYVGGVFGGNVKPTPFLCLILKMLQIQPEKDIVVEFIRNEDFKYVRALGAAYMRLTGTSLDCYKYLEPLYYDYRKMRIMNRDGKFELIHMDEYIDNLLRDDRAFDVILPRIQKRNVLEESNQLETRVSAIEEDIEEMETDEEEELLKEARRSPTPEKRAERKSPSPRRRSPTHKRDRHGKSRDEKPRSRSREKDKSHRSSGKRHKEDDDRKRKSKKSRSDRDRHESDKGRDRHHGDRDKHSRHDRERDRERRHKDKDRDNKERSHHHSRKDRLEDEIRQANELRAKLGMAPLRP